MRKSNGNMSSRRKKGTIKLVKGKEELVHAFLKWMMMGNIVVLSLESIGVFKRVTVEFLV